ncbi:MAG TPA: SPFH domain-containing protein [Thermoplasmata archaeon]|nr:SPFH domain-containing protein [Thermoplasmata archaeon]
MAAETIQSILLLGVVLMVLLFVLRWSIWVVRPKEEAVVVSFGRIRRTLGPGLHIVSPLSRVLKADLTDPVNIPIGAVGFVYIRIVPGGTGGRVIIGGRTIARASCNEALPIGTSVRVERVDSQTGFIRVVAFQPPADQLRDLRMS